MQQSEVDAISAEHKGKPDGNHGDCADHAPVPGRGETSLLLWWLTVADVSQVGHHPWLTADHAIHLQR
jgi:hypothetical protein